LFAQLNPPWDLTNVKALLLGVRALGPLPADLGIALAFRAEEVEFRAPPLPFRTGTAEMRFDLEGAWLPQKARAAVQQVALFLVTTNRTMQATIAFEKLSAAREP
jgi:hypothetical protein